MKTSSKLSKILICITTAFLVLEFSIFGNSSPVFAESEVEIGATVLSDYVDYFIQNSYFTLVPDTALQAEPVAVNVYIRGLNFSPMPGFFVQINVDPLLSCDITQPSTPTDANGLTIGYISCTNPGTYNVSATVTAPYNFTIDFTDSFSVSQITEPVMQPEPNETEGDENTVYWTPGTDCHEYYVEASTDAAFTAIIGNSGWISGDNHTFSGLSINVRYYYRTRCRNEFNYESDWSNTVDSRQIYLIFPPILIDEPEFTLGEQNTIYLTPGIGCVAYLFQVSTLPDFSVVMTDTGYIPSTFHTFTGLDIGEEYFYRARCQGPYSNQTAWSNTVSSTQVYEDIYLNIDSVTYDNNGIITVTVDALWDGITSAELLVSKDGGPFVSWGIITGELNQYDLNDVWGDNKELWYGVYTFRVSFTTMTDAVGESEQKVLEIKKQQTIIDDVVDDVTQNPIISFIMTQYEVIVDVVEAAQAFFEALPEEQKTAIAISAYTLTVVNVYVWWQALNAPYWIQLGLDTLSLIGLVKRPRKQGIAYDSITKEPLARVVVRVFNQDRQLLRTAVTDSKGIFHFKDVGEPVQFDANLKGYKFPSNIVLVEEDFPYTNVYTQSAYREFNKYDSAVSIPLDPSEYMAHSKLFRKVSIAVNDFFNRINTLMVVSGFLFSTFVILVTPVWYNYCLWALSIVFLFVKILELMSPTLKRKGRVVLPNGDPVSGITVDLIDLEFMQVVDRRITDDKGRFGFFIGKGKFTLSISSAYHKILAPDTEDGILVYNRSNKEKLINVKIVVIER